jgi:hypothetical protein
MSGLNGMGKQVQRLEERAPCAPEPVGPYERELSEDERLVIDRFFAIDETAIPRKAQFISGVHPFGFHREQFRYKKACIVAAIEHHRLVSEIEEMREWLTLVEMHGANYAEE